MNCWEKRWDLDKFIDDIDILDDGPFILEMMDNFSEQEKQSLLQPIAWEAQESLYEFMRIEYL
jgi:hypothetical protein